MMARSPIEMMIDQACEFDASKTVEWPVTIRCPICRTQKGAWRDKSDPKGTKVVEYPCAKCDDKSFGDPLYYSADGERIT